MTRTESCLKTNSFTRPVMIEYSSATSFLRSSRGTCDLRRRRSQSFLERAIRSEFGFAALRSCASAFCFACDSFEEVPPGNRN